VGPSQEGVGVLEIEGRDKTWELRRQVTWIDGIFWLQCFACTYM